MPLANQQLQVPFTGGPDQGEASEYLDPQTRILTVSNGRYIHDGSVEKRWGIGGLTNAALVNYPQIGTPIAAFTRGASLLATDGDGLYAYTPGVSAWTNVGGGLDTNPGNPGLQFSTGTVPQCNGTRSPLQPFTAMQSSPAAVGIAEGSGVRLVTYQQIGAAGAILGTGATLYDLTNGAVINTTTFGSGANTYNPIPIIVGNYAYVFFSDTGNVYWQQLNLTTQAFTQGTLVSDAANNVFDATPETNGSGAASGILVVYNQTGNAGRVRYLRLENLPALTVTASGYTPYRNGGGSGDGAADVIACRSDYALGITYIAWEPTAAGPVSYILVAAYNAPSWTQFDLGGVSDAFQPAIPGYTQGGSAGAGQISVEPLSATQFLINCFWGTVGQATYNSAAGTQAGSAQYPYGIVAGRPFRATVAGVTRCYMPFASYEQIQTAAGAFQFCSVHLMDTRAYEGHGFSPPHEGYPRVVATLAPRQAAQSFYSSTMQSLTWRPPMVTGIGNPTAGTYRLPIGILPSEEWQTPASQPLPVSLWLAQFDFAPSYCFTEGNGETYLGGCLPMMYAGQGLNEEGFHMWPSRITGVQSSGGNLTTSSTYGYAIVFAEVDAAGLIHRSAPYLLTVVLDNSHNAAQLTIPGIAYTQRQNVVVEVYRTQSAGAVYYYEGNVHAFAAAGITGTITYNSTLSDTAIASNTTIYTTGGALASEAPPCFRHRIKHLERHYGIDDTGLVIYFSQTFNPSDAPYYHDVLTLQFTEETLVALASMDGNLIIGSAQHLWYIQGYGPNALGQNSDAPPEPTMIPSDVGFASPQSLVTFPGGLLFQAPSGGMYVLGRDLSVSYVGLGIQDTITAGVSVVAAALVPKTHDIRLLLSTGAVVTYDYVRGRWATLSYPNTGTLTSAIVDNSGVWTACSSDGHVYQEKSATSSMPYTDTTSNGVTSWVTLSVTSAHVKLAQLQGYQRLRHLNGYATFLDPCDLSVTISYNYGQDSQGPQAYTYANLSAANPVGAQWDMHAKATAGQAMACQVTMSDASPTGANATTGQGCRFLGLAFDCQILAGRNQKIAKVVKA